jgi:hypothetical protein
VLHRLLSVVYPVRAYACSAECAWSGLLPSSSGWVRRRRQLQRLVIIVTLVMAAVLFFWKYGAELAWSPPAPPAGEASEE